jgi:hypothetical protein
MTKKIEFIIFDDFCCPKVSKIGIVKNPEYYGLITKGGRLKISFYNLVVNIEEFSKNTKENSELIYQKIKHLGERDEQHFIFSQEITQRLLLNAKFRLEEQISMWNRRIIEDEAGIKKIITQLSTLK